MSVPQAGFGSLEVPEMPAYVQSYTKRGNGFGAPPVPVYQQSRFGNRQGRGGMDAYLSQLEDPTFFESTKTKLGDTGVYEHTRWTSGYDFRGGGGIASLDASKNFRINSRGGGLRAGGPKRSSYMDRPNAWFERARPGISHSRFTQKNDNYAGVYDWKRRTPMIQRDNDALVLRDMKIGRAHV